LNNKKYLNQELTPRPADTKDRILYFQHLISIVKKCKKHHLALLKGLPDTQL